MFKKMEQLYLGHDSSMQEIQDLKEKQTFGVILNNDFHENIVKLKNEFILNDTNH